MLKRTMIFLIMTACLCASLAFAETFPPSSTPTLRGIDVSAWQRVIDWQRVRAAGIELAMIRASEGSGFVDPYFDRNDRGARAAGIAVGYYHFMTALTVDEAIAQADFFARTIDGRKPDLLLALDYGGGSSLSDAALTANAEAFLARVKQQTGYDVMLYTDAWAAKARYGASLARYPIWVANYGVTEPEANGKWSAWVGFQYSDQGDIPGISGRVDLDQFTREAYQGAPPTPTPTPAPTPVPTDRETLHYEVQANATIAALAAKLGTTVADLRSLNDIVNATAYAGQILRYPSSVPSDSASFAGLHVLQSWESLGTVARRYGTTANALRVLNALPSIGAPTGQVLRVPLAIGRDNVKAPPSWLLENVVMLLPGQTLQTIANQYQVSIATLRTINGLTAGDPLYAGQLLHLQAYGKDEQIGFSGGYVVQTGDSLVRIANRFGTTANTLYQLNNIANPRLIYAGMILLLP